MAVLVTENEFQMSQLVGVIHACKCSEGKQVNSDIILSILKNRLPSYMCPAKIIVSSNPLTRNKNGKVDYQKITEMIRGG